MNKLPKSLTNARCYYLDHKLVSKAYINTLHNLIRLDDKQIKKDTFILNTCLRYEIYNFSKNKPKFKDSSKFAFISGELCLRRFLSLLCGLQSEIIGEKEIILQARTALYNATQDKSISKRLFWDINILFDLAERIRQNKKLTQLENYSTVGAGLLNGKIKKPSTIAIIGGGYMAELFFKHIKKNKVKKLIWINRNPDKAKKIANQIAKIPFRLIEFCRIENCEEKMKEAEFVFSAVHNCGGIFSSLSMNKTKCVVDISYPSLFSDKVGCEFYSLNNTYFEKFIKKPKAKNLILKAEKEIDSIFNYL